jgi:hypothetical protein
MKKFSEFGIQPDTKKLIGEKIKIAKVFNIDITVDDFRIEDSRIKTGEKCLWLQIELKGEKRVIFTSSKSLIHQIQKVPATGFPFTTKIIEDNDTYEFT